MYSKMPVVQNHIGFNKLYWSVAWSDLDKGKEIFKAVKKTYYLLVSGHWLLN